MEKFAAFVIGSLVSKPDKVQIEIRSRGNEVLVMSSVDPSDVARVIGKSGQTIKSIKALLRAYGTKHKQIVTFEFIN